MKNRRVGTFTFGLMLITFGITFFLSNVYSYTTLFEILKYWPLVLVMLGFEILISGYIVKQEEVKYDKGSFFLIFLVICMLFTAAVGDYAVKEVISKDGHIKIIKE